jgi:YD repeat-containing protein
MTPSSHAGGPSAPHARRQPQFAFAALGAVVLGLASAASAQYEPPKQMTLSPTGVDLTTGRFTYKATDFSIGPFTLERSYVGGPPVDGSNYFGLNWTHNYSIYVVVKDLQHNDGVYVVIGRSTAHFSYISYNATYTSLSPDSGGETLVRVNGAFVYTDRLGNVYTFDASVNAFPPYPNYPLPNQRVARIDYADGHSLNFTYSGTQLRQIASNEGYSLVFDYGANGYVSRACGFNRAATLVTAASTCAGAALAVGYSYAPANWTQLTGVTDVMGQSWGYAYADDSNASHMTCVRQVNSSACLIANTYALQTNGATLRQTTADGGIWDYMIDLPEKRPEVPQLPGEPPRISGGAYSGPEGIGVSAVFGGGLLDSYTDGGKTTSLTWDGVEMASLAYPEGNKLTYVRSARSNVVTETWTSKPNSAIAAISRTTGYPEPDVLFDCAATPRKICNKPMWRKDYNGNQTDYTYDPAHGGVLTETDPAPVPGGIRPQVRYDYAARRAWVLGGGGYVPEAVSIYLPVRKSFCAKGAASGSGCALAGDEVVTTYDYGPDSGPNNLNLRGETVTADGISRRTCYAYDAQGNRISTTTPRAGLGTCP